MNNALRHRLAKAPAPARIVTLLAAVILCWLPIAIPCYRWISDTNTVSIVTLIVLYSQFLIALKLWGTHIDRCDRIWQQYGLERPAFWFRELGLGFLMASACLGGLFLCEGSWGWLQWQMPNTGAQFSLIVVEGILIGIGVGFAEELMFRGWLLAELRRSYPAQTCLLTTSILFAALHFIRPLPKILETFPQFGGLILLGLLLVWARRATQGRLGLAIGLHAGLVSTYYWIKVGNLFRYTQQVPEWVTGLQGNPLAGLAGIITLLLLTMMVRGCPKHRAIISLD